MSRSFPTATRVFCLIARDAPLGVVFRRGPSKLVQILQWDLTNDTFAPGQWFKGRIYERRCDLSPSGRLLIYFAAKHRGPFRTWTAISRPPYLTALALWPKGDTWGGGGLFVDEQIVELNHRSGEMGLASGFELPRQIRLSTFETRPGLGFNNPLYASRVSRDGWAFVKGGEIRENSVIGQPAFWEKSVKGASQRLVVEMHGIHPRGGPKYVEHFKLRNGAIDIDLGKCDWADLLVSGDIVFARDGQIYRLSSPFDVTDSQPLIDLRSNKFEEIVAPEEYRKW